MQSSVRFLGGLLAASWLSVSASAQVGFREIGRPYPSEALVAPGDYDGDGDLDGLGFTNFKFDGTVLVNDGHARFAAAPAVGLVIAVSQLSVVPADFDGDGLTDLLVTSDIYVASTVAPKLWLCGPGYTFTVGPPLPPTGPLLFSAGVKYVVSAAAGDVDGDGDADVVVGTLATGGNGQMPDLWLNMGGGVFALQPPAAFTAAPAPWGRVRLVDLDTDGDLDVVLSGVGAVMGGARALRNLNGTFATMALGAVPAPIAPNVPYPTDAVEVGEFNGDGYRDLVAISTIKAVALGGPIGFGPWSASTVNYGEMVFGVIDVDADGTDEVLLADSAKATVLDVPAAGSGAFPVVSIPAALAGSGLDLLKIAESASADLDGDGDRDYVLGRAGLLMNDGAGTPVWVRARGAVRGDQSSLSHGAVDLNGDGLLDVVGLTSVLPSGIGVASALADGDGGYVVDPTYDAVFAVPVFFFYDRMATYDFDADGDLDLYLGCGASGTQIDLYYPGTATGGFGPAVTRPAPSFGSGASFGSAVVLCDLNVDGLKDLVMIPLTTPGASGNTAVVVGNVGGVLQPPAALGIQRRTRELLVGDFDGDGAEDVLQVGASTPTPTPSVIHAARLGGAATIALPGISGQYAAAGDLDGDGTTDLVIDGSVYFFVAGAPTPGPPLPGPPLAGRGELVDLDGDGDLDLIEAPAAFRLNLGAANFGPVTTIIPATPNTPPMRVRTADLDRDGDLDLLAPGPHVLVNVARQIAPLAPPRLGRPSGVDLFGAPGGGWALFFSPSPAEYALAPYGTLLIEPTAAVSAGVGVYPVAGAADAGRASIPFFVPDVPALLGLTLYWQAVDLATARLTNRLTSVVDAY